MTLLLIEKDRKVGKSVIQGSAENCIFKWNLNSSAPVNACSTPRNTMFVRFPLETETCILCACAARHAFLSLYCESDIRYCSVDRAVRLRYRRSDHRIPRQANGLILCLAVSIVLSDGLVYNNPPSHCLGS